MGLFSVLLISLSTLAGSNKSPMNGAAKLFGCSGALVILKGIPLERKALVLTNDHCIDDQGQGRFSVNLVRKQPVVLYKNDTSNVTVNSPRIIYATQTDTDIALLELDQSYRELIDKHGIRPYRLKKAPIELGVPVRLISGFWKEVIPCRIHSHFHELVEDEWVWRGGGSMTCELTPGTGASGSPVLNGRDVVGLFNTSNDVGPSESSCELEEPCERSATGETSAYKDRHYVQRTDRIYSCFKGSQFSLDLVGCELLGGKGYRRK